MTALPINSPRATAYRTIAGEVIEATRERIVVALPLKLVSEANSHTHWRKRQKRAKGHHEVTGFLVGAALAKADARGQAMLPCVVTITRIAPRALDSDNLVGSAKHCRDSVAAAFGIDDRDPRVEWRVAQERGAPNTYGARVEIVPAANR